MPKCNTCGKKMDFLPYTRSDEYLCMECTEKLRVERLLKYDPAFKALDEKCKRYEDALQRISDDNVIMLDDGYKSVARKALGGDDA